MRIGLDFYDEELLMVTSGCVFLIVKGSWVDSVSDNLVSKKTG
jgi:hypothetical protein